MNTIKKQHLWRVGTYGTGTLILALGNILSTKTNIGVSPINAVSYSISRTSGIAFSVVVFFTYLVMIALQFLIKGKDRQWRDLLQLPLNFVFSTILGWMDGFIHLELHGLWQNLAVMAVSILCTGIGIAMMVNMQIVPNPPDGLAYAVSLAIGRDMGLGKNLLDLCCVAAAVTLDLLVSRRLVSVGLGTLLCMVFIGRTVALFNHFCKRPLERLAGLEPPAAEEKIHPDLEGTEL